MKTLIILAIFLSPIYLLGQIKNSEKKFSLSFQVGYLFPQNTGGGSYSSLVPDIEYRPSIHYKLSKTVTPMLEFSYCKLKYESKERENRSFIFKTINLGLKIYPKSGENIYLKPALTFSLVNKYNIKSIANINFGIGNDIKISNAVEIFGEAGIFLRNNGYTYSFSLSAGLNYKIF